ncbi:hypothetical protein LCGC14_2018300 [marine sediment metagenome]|uniref:DUF5678 domain-containing protein n=1 Tax=marine sediment metagenome TaxID=412755 RepID=A0A0F9EYB0_9ZZZZ
MGVLSEFGVDEERLTGIAKILNKSKIWFHKNYNELQNLYEGKFVAVREEKVVESDENRDTLLGKLNEKFMEKKVDETLIEYINPKGYILILFLK